MIQYINLPQVPKELISELLSKSFDEYEKKVNYQGIYTWTDSFNERINAWCKENICKDMHWGFQFISADLPIHKDVGTKIKFVYLIESGGDCVTTDFLNDDETTILNSYVIDKERWHILQADVNHRVVGVEPGKTRFSITGRIF